MIVCEEDKIMIRLLEDKEGDYALLHNWLTSDHVLRHYQGRDNPSTLDGIRDEYRPRTKGELPVASFIIEYKNNPIGYVQYYQATEEEKTEFGYDKTQSVMGFDIFIGDVLYRNKGLGTTSIKLLTNHIMSTYKPDALVVDPRVVNKRAINTYHKCGFNIKKILKQYELHEGTYYDNYLMEYQKS